MKCFGEKIFFTRYIINQGKEDLRFHRKLTIIKILSLSFQKKRTWQERRALYTKFEFSLIDWKRIQGPMLKARAFLFFRIMWIFSSDRYCYWFYVRGIFFSERKPCKRLYSNLGGNLIWKKVINIRSGKSKVIVKPPF